MKKLIMAVALLLISPYSYSLATYETEFYKCKAYVNGKEADELLPFQVHKRKGVAIEGAEKHALDRLKREGFIVDRVKCKQAVQPARR
jgi:hypothetical protein